MWKPGLSSGHSLVLRHVLILCVFLYLRGIPVRAILLIFLRGGLGAWEAAEVLVQEAGSLT